MRDSYILLQDVMELANATRHCSVWYRFMPMNLECAAIVECIVALQFNYAWMNISILLCVNKESPGSCNDDQHMAWFPLSEIQQFLVPLFLFDWKRNGSMDQIDNIYFQYKYIHVYILFFVSVDAFLNIHNLYHWENIPWLLLAFFTTSIKYRYNLRS